MVKKIFQCGYISYMTDANRVAYILKHIPFVGRKIHSDSARAFGIIGIACRIIWEIIKKAVFVAAAMLGPMYVLNHLDLLILLKRRNEAYADLQRLMKMGYSKGQLLEFYNRLKKK